MKKVAAAIILCLTIALYSPAMKLVYAGIDDVSTSAGDAQGYSRKAQNARTLKQAQDNSRRAMQAAENAESEASSLGSDDAAGYAGEAYDYARRARNAKTLEEAESYSRKAKLAAENAQLAIEETKSSSEIEEVNSSLKEGAPLF